MKANTANVMLITNEGVPDWLEAFSGDDKGTEAEEFFIQEIENIVGNLSEEDMKYILDQGYYKLSDGSHIVLCHSME